MSVGFAGSARLGERRRRRLAQETDAPTPSKKKRYRVDAAHTEEPLEPPSLEGESPLDRLLPQRRWPLVLLTIVSFWSLVAAMAIALIGEFDPRLQSVVGIDHGQLLRTIGTGLLLGSAQWAAVIYWYRKRGRRDFAGDYRRWLLAGLTCLLALPCWAGGMHHLVGEFLSPRLPAADWNTPQLCWMVPFGTAVTLYGLGLLREMLPIRLRGLLLMAGLGWLFAAAVALLSGPQVLAPIACERLARLFTLTAFWCVFHSLWLQARHVVRVTNEPLRQKSFQPLALRQAVESSLSAVDRAQRIATAPGRVVRESVTSWRTQRAEAAAERATEREARREQKAAAKAAAIADREAMKQAKQEEREQAAEAKREAKAAAAAAKQETAEAKRQAKEDARAEKRKAAEERAMQKELEAGEARAARERAKLAAEQAAEDESEDPEDPQDAPSPAESRGRRRGGRRNEERQQQHSAPEPEIEPESDDDDEDLSHLSRKERRRLRKQRQQRG